MGNARRHKRLHVGKQPPDWCQHLIVNQRLADFFGVVDGQGVLITSVTENSPAAKAGLKAGDVITAVDGEKIDGAGDLSRAINKQKDGEITLTVVRDKNQRT